MLLNPWVLLGLVLSWGVSLGGAGWFMYERGRDNELATQARENRIAAVARESAASGTAAAIAKLRPQITTIRQETEREIRTNTIYGQCRHSPDQLQRINAALTGAASEPAGGGLVPPPDALGR